MRGLDLAVPIILDLQLELLNAMKADAVMSLIPQFPIHARLKPGSANKKP